MEAQTDLQNYLEQGRTELAQGHGREAAIAYAHGAQLDPADPAVHLGLAESNLALGNLKVVQMACRKVQELQPQGHDAQIAQALLDLMDKRYARALQVVDAAIADDPGNAYDHALRSYLLRATGQDYDANLARARATRLSYGGRFEHCFPELEKAAENSAAPAASVPPVRPAERTVERRQTADRDAIPTWSRPNTMRRNMIRTRFFLNQNPGFITNVIIALSIVLFILSLINNNIFWGGAQIGIAILAGQVWRLVTGVFLYYPSLDIGIFNVAISLLSLFFVGRVVEIFYGQWRYILLYLIAGVVGGIVAIFLAPAGLGPGPSASILGIFGALGVFYLTNRRALGSYAISSWAIWLVLILFFDIQSGYIFVDLATLIISMGAAFLLLPRRKSGSPLL